MTRIRVTPAELRTLDNRCRSEAQQIEQVKLRVGSAIANTDWDSPAAQRFRSNWDADFRPVLDKLYEALADLGAAASTMAGNYEATEAAYRG